MSYSYREVGSNTTTDFKFPKFSQGLRNDPTTRKLWFSLAVAHDFESHDGMTES
jgi:hypothetical protein